jgi:hypothetical protein
MLTPFPGTVDFAKWEEKMASDPTRIAGYPLTRFWLIPRELRPKVYTPHPMLTPEQIRRGTQTTWDRFYNIPAIWEAREIVKSFKARLAFLFISKLYRQMCQYRYRHRQCTREPLDLGAPARPPVPQAVRDPPDAGSGSSNVGCAAGLAEAPGSGCIQSKPASAELVLTHPSQKRESKSALSHIRRRMRTTALILCAAAVLASGNNCTPGAAQQDRSPPSSGRGWSTVRAGLP